MFYFIFRGIHSWLLIILAFFITLLTIPFQYSKNFTQNVLSNYLSIFENSTFSHSEFSISSHFNFLFPSSTVTFLYYISIYLLHHKTLELYISDLTYLYLYG